MTEAELLEYSRPVIDVYTAMEHDLMVAVAAQIAKDGFVSAASKWRMQKLAEAGELNRTAVNIIASYTGIQSDVLTEAITSAAYDVIDNIEPALQSAARDGVISDAAVSASASAKRVISTYHKQAKSDLNLVNTVMRYKAKEAYVDLVNKTYDAVNAIEDVSNRQELLNTLGKHTMSAVTGAESRSAAVRRCIQEFNAKGIPAFVDAAGRQWSPEAYVNMDIKTTVSNVAHAAQDARCDEYGIDLIEVSSHKGARPKCAPYQGRIFSRSNKSGTAHDGSGREIQYSPLSETSYGEPDGLFGINCHHKKYPFIDGVNFRRYFPYEKDENDAYYAALQKQRQLERRIREQKREIDMLKEVGDDEGIKAARAKLREQQAKYKEFSEKNDLAMRKSRTAVQGYRTKANKELAALNNKMASSTNDWSKTVPQKHSAEELEKISAYAKERGVKLYQPNTYDGDIEILRQQIDTISGLKTEYNINQKITLRFTSMSDDDFAETVNNTICFNNKAMRNSKITNQNLNADNQLAATDFTGIAVHEMGHIISRTYGEKGLDIAKQAYYNIFKEEITTDDVLKYLSISISKYSVDFSEMSKKPKYKEITPEVLSKSNSASSSDFADEFVKLLKEACL